MITIDYNRAVELVTAAMEQEGPEYVYDINDHGGSCRNVERDKDGKVVGSCLIGRALILGGVPAEWFARNAGSNSVSTVSYRLANPSYLSEGLEETIEFTAEAECFMAGVQMEQDSQTPWGEAIRLGKQRAEERYPNVKV